MQEDEFWDEELQDPTDPWGQSRRSLNTDLVMRLARGPLPGDDDLTSAINLTRLALGEYQGYGTDGSESLTNDEARICLRAVRLVLERRSIPFSPPWRDFVGFRSYWIRVGASGSGGWQARRDLLEEHFGPVLDALERAEEHEFRAELAEGVSAHSRTGWQRVDEEISQLRQRFRSASTAQDYRNVGNRAVGVLEAFSSTVYDDAMHCPPGQKPPPVDKTDIRIGEYINTRLMGGANEELRGLVKKSSALAHKTKHSSRANRVNAGIAADAAILLANVLRRLAED